MLAPVRGVDQVGLAQAASDRPAVAGLAVVDLDQLGLVGQRRRLGDRGLRRLGVGLVCSTWQLAQRSVG